MGRGQWKWVLGEGALCKNVQKLRPPPRQRGVGRRMAPQSGARKPTVSIGEVSSCHAALTTAECDSASEPGVVRVSDTTLSGVGGTNLMPRLRPMVCVPRNARALDARTGPGNGCFRPIAVLQGGEIVNPPSGRRDQRGALCVLQETRKNYAPTQPNFRQTQMVKSWGQNASRVGS